MPSHELSHHRIEFESLATRFVWDSATETRPALKTTHRRTNQAGRMFDSLMTAITLP